MKKEAKPEPAKTKNVIVTSIIIVLGLFLLSSFFAFIIGVAILVGGDTDIDGNVAVIEVKGVISGDGYSSFTEGAAASSVTTLLASIADDPGIEAVVIEINSPGGSPVGSAEIAEAVGALDKPTVAWIREVGASGGYWVASAADHVIAHELSVTGSIGVYGSYLDFSGFLDDKNVSYQRLVSGEFKDTGSPLRPLTSTEEMLLQAKMDTIREVFVRAVADNRNLSYEDVDAVAHGMYLLGGEALDAGLVDGLGGKAEVTAYLESLNITPTYSYVRESGSLLDALAGVVSHHGFSIGEGVAAGLQREDMLVRT